jgi:hypothetical protein
MIGQKLRGMNVHIQHQVFECSSHAKHGEKGKAHKMNSQQQTTRFEQQHFDCNNRKE